MKLDYIDRSTPGWFALDVVQATGRKWDWVVLMVDVHPRPVEALPVQHSVPLRAPRDYKLDGTRTAQEAWFRVPSKHRNKGAAWDA